MIGSQCFAMRGTIVPGFLAALLLHIVTTGDCCTEGFPDFDTVNSLAQACASDGGCLRGSRRGNVAGTTYVIPDMRITYDGSVVRWRSGGEIINGGSGPDPRLQIWRPTSPTSTIYTVQTEISLFDCNGGPLTEVAPNIYECLLSPGVPVQRGDILGIFLRRVMNMQNQFRVYFDSSSTDPPVVTNYFYESMEIMQFSLSSPGGQTEQALPLVALEIVEEGSTAETLTQEIITESTTSVLIPTSTEGNTVEITTPTQEGALSTASVPPTQEETSSTDEIVSSEGSETITSSTSTVEENQGISTIGQNTTSAFTTDSSEPQSSSAITTHQVMTDSLISNESSSTNLTVLIVIVVTGLAIMLTLTTTFVVFVFILSRRRKANIAVGQKTDYFPFRDSNQRLLSGRMRNVLAKNYEMEVRTSMGLSHLQNLTGICVPSAEERALMLLNSQSQAPEYATIENFGDNRYSYVQCTPDFFSEHDEYWCPASNESDLYQQLSKNKYREISRNQIRLEKRIGSGQFGAVSKGLWELSPGKYLDCAIKTLHPTSSEDDKVKFLQEAATNGQFHHPNVVQLLGVVTIGEPVLIVLELLGNGDLFNFLHKMRPCPGELLPSETPHQLLKFCQQVSSGMEYLSRKGFVHRDLAARNILVSSDKICKVADFGMSRRMKEEYYVSNGGKIPVKWTAPEALYYKKYSTASDVWSFGALMYEIWSVGHKPFEEYDNNEVNIIFIINPQELQVIKIVNKGFRLPPPPGCPRRIYELMIQCWHPKKNQRPSFSQTVEKLSTSEYSILEVDLDVDCDPSAGTLGAPLTAADDLYKELQKSYRQD